jgi:hypothetical protein
VAGIEPLLEIQADELLVARDDPQLGDRRRVGRRSKAQATPRAARLSPSRRPASSSPIRPMTRACAPREAALSATLPAPPARTSSFFTCTTGTGASGEMRAVAPCQYRSSITSPHTSTRQAEKSGKEKCMRRQAPARPGAEDVKAGLSHQGRRGAKGVPRSLPLPVLPRECALHRTCGPVSAGARKPRQTCASERASRPSRSGLPVAGPRRILGRS